jgi:carboxyl-terminal processing protease
VTTLRTRDGHITEYKTDESGIDIRMVLLVNEYSASASELVAGALKDHGAAYLIGTRTYGKGIVQSFYEIPETKGYIKITTDAYYTPNGVCVQDEGILPDQITELSEEAKQYSIDRIPYELDTQLQAAIAYLED